MKGLVDGSRFMSAGIARTTGAMVHVVGSIPSVALAPLGNPLNMEEAKRKISRLKSRYRFTSGIALGDLTDDLIALQQDTVVLGDDMWKAKRRMTHVERG